MCRFHGVKAADLSQASRVAALAIALSSTSACSPMVSTEGAGGGEQPDPPLQGACAAADQGIDWSACEGNGFDPRREAGRYCTNQSATPGCEDVADAYYRCLADHAAACTATYDPESGLGSYSVIVSECQDAFDAFGKCIGECGGSSECPTNELDHCNCTAPSPNAGTTCCWYPGCPEDGSIPNCYAVCSDSCTPPP